MKSRKIKIGIIQNKCESDKKRNIANAVKNIKQAAKGGAKIICLQELFSSQYFCISEKYEPFKLAEKIPGPTTNLFSDLAKKLGVVIVASLFEKRTNGIYHNTAAVIDADGKYLGKYRKMHIPDDPSFYEKFYFTPGDLGFKSFKTKFCNIGVLICWDQWYPEAARLTALSGAEILFYPTAIGWAVGEDKNICKNQHNAWRTMQQSHAIANGIPVVSVNRVGVEGNLNFWGASFVANTLGEIVFEASHNKEEIKVIEIDLNQSDTTRTHWPFLRDRRIDAYSPILNRFNNEED